MWNHLISSVPTLRRWRGGRSAQTAIVAAGIVAMAFGCLSCRGTDSEKVESINFGTVPTAASALIYVAQDQDFFASNNLSVNIKDFFSGVASVDALLKGETDISWAAEFPFVRKTFEREQLSVLAVVDRFNEDYLFGRKDRGINTVSDLKGKTIGIPVDTIIYFYLGRFLNLNGMTTQDVTIVNIPAQGSVDAIASGKVDGVVIWEPYCSQIRAKLGDSAVAWSVQSSQPGYGTILVRNDWISGQKKVIHRFLRSLAQAEEYMIHKPEIAKTILRKRLNYEEGFTERIWSQHRFTLSLDQSLILAMEDEARWMIKNNMTGEKTVPDFLRYIFEDPLKAIRPEAVNIIR
jgi:NitT/TauT family transport system substrate-binding protein